MNLRRKDICTLAVASELLSSASSDLKDEHGNADPSRLTVLHLQVIDEVANVLRAMSMSSSERRSKPIVKA